MNGHLPVEPALRANSPRIALLVPSSVRINTFGRRRLKAGGADMRFETVHEAIDRAHGCALIESPCERNIVCASRCAVTGKPSGGGPFWYYDSTYCERSTEILADELVARGVKTVVCSSLNVYRHILHLASRPELKIVFDLHNIEYANYRAMRESIPRGSAFDLVLSDENVDRIAAAERAAIEAADVLWTCTDDDVALVRSTYDAAADKPIDVVRDVVDVPATLPEDDSVTHIVFTASLYYYPNVLAALELLLEIAPLIDPFPAVVAGAQPGPELLDLDLPPNTRIVADPPDITAVTTNGIMVVPLRYGGGSRFKIIEAFARGIPVVSTLKGAEGLLADPGVHYLRAESTAEFAEAISHVREDRVLRSQLVRAGWELAQRHYSVDALAANVAALPTFV